MQRSEDKRDEESSEFVDTQSDQGGVDGFDGALGDGGDGQEGVCEHDQDGPAVPGGPGANLMLVESGEPLLDWKDSSMVHRRPATRTNSVSEVCCGCEQRW